MALLSYAITLFVSAFLLFLVQPVIGQMILPRLGGTPSVWNTCVVFFQCALLVGYAYTHFSSKLPVKRQILIHCGLLFLPFLILFMPFLTGKPEPHPFYVEDFQPVSGENPIVPTLLLLSVIVGIPFFVVSTTAPLLQKWFGTTGHPAAKDPYFLYGASNLGSMLSLLLYPVLFEPLFGLRHQAWIYTIGYMVLVVLVLGCAFMAFMTPAAALSPAKKKEDDQEYVPGLAPEPPITDIAAGPAPSAAQMTAPASTAITGTPPGPSPTYSPNPTTATGIKKGGKKGKGRDLARMAPATVVAPAASMATTVTAAPPSIAKPHVADPDEITWPRRLRWIGLAAVPSSLMLGVTMYMSTDISAIPLFWVLPLALYLLSFILVFMRWPINWLEQAHEYVLYIQPVLLSLLVLFIAISGAPGVIYMILIMLLAFTVTALACHGEMAKDRPSAKHLTEFYLMMSVGGAIGGLFNGIIAPLIFPWGIVEFGLALAVAGLLRPVMRETGWTETLLANMGGGSDSGKHHHGKGAKKITKTNDEAASLTFILDFALPLGVTALLAILLWGVFQPPLGSNRLAELMFYATILPLACAACMFGRPLRFGLSLAAILLLTGMYLNSGGSVMYTTRSYFGLLRVRQSREAYTGLRDGVPYRSLMHGTTHHGMAFQPTEGAPDFSRVATTYYHRQGPVGICMERFNWFPKDYDNNSFWADGRMPMSLMGLGVPVPGINLPIGVLCGVWSEPPYAVIGMGTATMASYARPYHTCHFYEIDQQVKLLSLPGDTGPRTPDNKPFFGYVDAAQKRNAEIKIMMGDARQRMAMPWVPKAFQAEYKDCESKNIPFDYTKVPFDQRGGPEHFYHLMVVDAFSSDAIPRHLITKESMEMYFNHLVQGYWKAWDDTMPSSPHSVFRGEGSKKEIWIPGGVLCVHTSNRHLKLVPVVTDTAAVAEWKDKDGTIKKGLVAWRGHDSAPGHQFLDKPGDLGHFTSEWVIVARDNNDLKHLTVPRQYNDWIREAHAKYPNKVAEREDYWTFQQPTGTPERPGRFVWTDDHTNLMAVLRWPWQH